MAPATDPVEVVTTFLAALEELDIDRALELVSPDIVYQNVPLPPARGTAQFARQMRFVERWFTGFEAEVHTIAADGTSVLTERTDVLERGPCARSSGCSARSRSSTGASPCGATASTG